MIVNTSHFGAIAVDESSAIEFPEGLPGFEGCRRFVPLHRADTKGLIFLQSVETPQLCFVTVPLRAFWPEYQLQLTAEESELLADPAGEMVEQEKLGCLAILSFVEAEEPTANLLAPIVIHPHTRRALQAVRCDGRYAARTPLPAEDAVCS